MSEENRGDLLETIIAEVNSYLTTEGLRVAVVENDGLVLRLRFSHRADVSLRTLKMTELALRSRLTKREAGAPDLTIVFERSVEQPTV